MIEQVYTTQNLQLITTKNIKTAIWGLRKVTASELGKEIKMESMNNIAASLVVFYFIFPNFQLGLRGSSKEEKLQEKFTPYFYFQRTGKEEYVRWGPSREIPSYFLFVLFTWLSPRQATVTKLYTVDVAAMHVPKILGETLLFWTQEIANWVPVF